MGMLMHHTWEEMQKNTAETVKKAAQTDSEHIVEKDSTDKVEAVETAKEPIKRCGRKRTSK